MSHVPHVLSDNTNLTDPFPVTHSILSTTALLSEIFPLYDLTDQISCILLARGVNDTYLVQASKEKYIRNRISTTPAQVLRQKGPWVSIVRI